MVRALFVAFFLLTGCASWRGDQVKDYRKAYLSGDFTKAIEILKNSPLKKEKRNILLWHLEKGTLALSMNELDAAISHFQTSVEIIDSLYTVSVSKKVASLLINDTKDVFYGARYERSYAYYFLAKSFYARFLKSGKKLDLQGARAAVVAWDTFFTHSQRSMKEGTLYSTDLVLKIFGGEIHEASEINTDKQIALQLYKDALKILDTQAGIYPVFNKTYKDYVKYFESEKKANPKLYAASLEKENLKKFLHYKILSLTKKIRSSDFEKLSKEFNASSEMMERAFKGPGNVVLVFEEGLIPNKVGQKFDFGIKGAVNKVSSPAAKAFIQTVGVEALAAFAMNKLGMTPQAFSNSKNGVGNFVLAHNVTKLAVSEAAISFELPSVEKTTPLKTLELFILSDKGEIIKRSPLPVVAENADIARVVLEEDMLSRYAKVGTRVALKHIVAIVSAMQLYQRFHKGKGQGDFLAKTAAMAAYVAASKGIAYSEEADTRHWSTLPRAIRMMEFRLEPGTYKLGLAPYNGATPPEKPITTIGEITVDKSQKLISHFSF